MVNVWNIVFLILIIILFILVIVLFVQTNQNTNNADNDGSNFNILNPTTYFSEIKKDKDFLIHCSSKNQNLVKMLDNLTSIYGHIDFLSLVNISNEILVNLFTTNNKEINYVSYNKENNDYILNSTNQLMQGFIETRHLNNFNAVSLKIGYPLSVLDIIKNGNSYAYIRKYKRYVDKKDFYYIQINIDSKLTTDTDKYTNLASILAYIKKTYTGDFMFVGNFSVQGHEFVFSNYFKEKDYLICSFYQTLTANDENGLTAYDGLVVSRNLYNAINYKIEFCPSDNIDNYMIVVELSYAGFGTIKNSSSVLFKKYIDNVIENIKNRKNYINDRGTYSANNITENTSKIEKVNL